MADNQGARATAGDFVGGVGQNIVANICASAIGAGCVAIGLAEKPDLADPTNWRIWVVAFGVVALGLFGSNTARLAIRNAAARSGVRKASGERIALMIARLDGDPGDARRASLRDLIKRELGEAVHITLWPQALTLAEGRDVDAEARAYKTAQAWLKRKNCDLLVWGSVRSDQTVALRFTSRDSAGEHTPYALSADAMEIPETLQTDLSAAIVARVLAQAAPASDNSQFIVPLMRDLAARIEPLARQMKTGRARGEIWYLLSVALAAGGMQAGTSEDLEAAIDAHREALKAFPKETAPHQWAVIRADSALASKTLGQWRRDKALLRSAVAAYSDALEILTQDSVPNLWAPVQIAFANALTNLAELEDDIAGLERAIAFHKAAIQAIDQDHGPLLWARGQHNLGVALAALAHLKHDAGVLRDAAAAYRLAREVRTRDRAPLHWAVSQNNLGRCFLTLGQWEHDAAALKKAVEAFREVLEERTRDRVPILWARTRYDLGRALLSLGEQEGDTAYLIEAVAAFREALEEFTEAWPHERDWVEGDLDRARAVIRGVLQARAQPRPESLEAD